MSAKIATALVAWGIIIVGAYLVQVDRAIVGVFEGRRWSVPAQVFAQPEALYPGAAIDRSRLIRELQRLGYVPQSELSRSGTFDATPVHHPDDSNQVRIHLRSFNFLDAPRRAEKVTVYFADRKVERLTTSDGRALNLLRLDPAVIGSFFDTHGEDRLILTPTDVPRLLTDALKAVEDRNFDHHPGFDLRGILRAAWINLRNRELQQGGSTLTQQLVKSYFLDNRRTLGRKLRELAMAVILELRFSKPDLMNAYVNEIYLGQAGRRAIHGFGLGAQFYFNKPLVELEVAEIATLIAIIRGPSYYNPFRFPERVRTRRDLVLATMHSHKLIDDAALEQASAAPLGVSSDRSPGLATGVYYPAFLDLVRRQLQTSYDDAVLAGRGLRVFTTLSPRDQEALDIGVTEALGALERGRDPALPPLEIAAVMTNAQTGEVLALTGGRDATLDGFNRALEAKRPLGSLIKPVIYLVALEQGFDLTTQIVDQATAVTLDDGKLWTPHNFDRQHHGPVPLVRALGDSLNLATVRLGMEIGVPTIAERLERLSGHRARNRFPSLLLGAEAMTVTEVASLYGSFASRGFRMAPKAVISVQGESGEVLTRHPIAMTQQIKPHDARRMSAALQATMSHGTGRSSRFARTGIAGKTGTTDDFRDSWFAGYDAQRLLVVWLGHDDNSPAGLTGSRGALKVWDAVFARLDIAPIKTMANATTVEYATGLAAAEDCAAVVQLPLDEDTVLRSKPGCDIPTARTNGGLRGLFNRGR